MSSPLPEQNLNSKFHQFWSNSYKIYWGSMLEHLEFSVLQMCDSVVFFFWKSTGLVRKIVCWDISIFMHKFYLLEIKSQLIFMNVAAFLPRDQSKWQEFSDIQIYQCTTLGHHHHFYQWAKDQETFPKLPWNLTYILQVVNA